MWDAKTWMWGLLLLTFAKTEVQHKTMQCTKITGDRREGISGARQGVHGFAMLCKASVASLPLEPKGVVCSGSETVGCPSWAKVISVCRIRACLLEKSLFGCVIPAAARQPCGFHLKIASCFARSL